MYVNTTGNDDIGNGTAENPYLTIKKGITDLTENGTLFIGKGIYNGTKNTNIAIDKNLNIIGESQTGTIINGTDMARIFTIFNKGTLNIRNLTLTGGTADYGSAICNYGGNCTVSDCIFINNSANGGGAIFNGVGNCTVIDCTFNGNTAWDGGAICNYGGNSNLTGCIFMGNAATDYGGAISNYECISSIMAGCIFTSNTAYRGGGAISNNAGNCKVTRSIFTGNAATLGYGGAIFNYGNDISIFNFNRIAGNTAPNGNAIYNYYGPMEANNNWWGSNLDPKTINNLIAGSESVNFDNVNTTNWVILTVNATPNNIKNTKNSTITADFNHINGGSELT